MANQRSKDKTAMTFSFIKTFVNRLRGLSATTGETATAIVERGTTNEMDLIEARENGIVDADMAARLARLADLIDSIRDHIDAANARLDNDQENAR